MIILETIERECCNRADLKQYCGLMSEKTSKFKPVFCRHCGQIWRDARQMDAAGSMETVLERIEI